MSGLQWVVDAYILIFASWLLTAGTLGLLLFTIASKLCGAATSLETLIAAHLFQGIGTALMVPASLSLISHTFIEPVEKARAIRVWAAVTSIAQSES